MKKVSLLLLLTALVGLMLNPTNLRAQGNIDWEELWFHQHPLTTSGPFGWMAGNTQYTGLAYDRIRDQVYVVNPAMCVVGSAAAACPKIWILDAETGLIKTSQGRGLLGQGGQIPVPTDTIHGFPNLGWPGGTWGSYSQGTFPVFRIDVDDVGRIFACNIVAPIWGVCRPPSGPCDPVLYNIGPFRIFRWDTPKSSPKRVYATLNATGSGLGSLQSSEMKYTRWGDVFTVVGGLRTISTPQGPQVVDSIRIFTSGGIGTGAVDNTPFINEQINVILADPRPEEQRISNGMGGKLEYRLGVKLVNSLSNRASHGIAPEGKSSTHEIWHDSNTEVTMLNNQGQSEAPWPQTIPMALQHTLNPDPINGTGPSGPLAFFTIPASGKKYLVCYDGRPENINDLSQPSNNSRARILNVTNRAGEFREPGFGNTPIMLGASLQTSGGTFNFVSDGDYKIDPDPVTGQPHVVLFVLMSKNGIAAYRSRIPIYVPVELTTFHGVRNGSRIDLTWEVTSEQNNHGFEIQRSFDEGTSWETISFIQGRGTVNLPKTYTYSDAITSTHERLPFVKYRLRQVDIDGRATLSPVVEVYMEASPANVILAQNYPNPFNPSTSISYQLSTSGFVTLRVLNPLGEEVRTLVNEFKEPGTHSVTFQADGLPSGTYMYQINFNNYVIQKKMVLTK